jgi:phage terminase large subunit-like protein
MSSAERYANWVLNPSNAVKTGQYIKLAAKRFLSDLKRADIYFDEDEACRMINFGERYCNQWEGDWEGLPVKFEPWQRFIFEQVYGWIRKDTGTRRFDEAYVQVAKKNGKSTMCAVLIDFHVLADEKVKTPKVFTGANNEDQAKICVNMAGRIIEGSPALAELLEDETVKVFKYKDAITEIIHTEKNGLVKAFSKETSDRKSKTAGGKQGVNASLGVIDEFGMSADHGVSKPIKTSMASRKERLMFYITTAGPNMDGPCFQELRKVGIQVLEGTVIKDNYLPMIYEMDPEDDWKDEVNWYKPNPNLDISVNRDFLRGMVSDAVTYGGRTEVDVKTYNFDMWVDSPEVFISGEIWDTNSHGLTVEDGETCYAGLQVGPSGDISALALLFPGEITRIKMLWMIAEEDLKTNDFYRENRQLIKVDPGNVLDNDVAIGWITEEFQKYNLHSFCFPKPHEKNSIVQGLIKQGYEGNPISEGLSSISTPTDAWEKMLRSAQIEHFNDPILKWHNSNCLAVRKEAGIRLEKNGKVLGIWACIMAVAQWQTVAANSGTATVDIW